MSPVYEQTELEESAKQWLLCAYALLWVIFGHITYVALTVQLNKESW